MKKLSVSGNIIDLQKKCIFPGIVHIEKGRIVSVCADASISSSQYILPGFIDAHVHIESSMLVPSEFARLAVTHGTVATVSDPHEIGNVLGIEGVKYMIRNGRQVPFHFHFGAPPCIPATPFETAGAAITADDIRQLFEQEHLQYLSEVMNYPGVIARDPTVMKKIREAQTLGLPIDGHAPGLRGPELTQYITAGISTDHESYTLEEAIEKIKGGMKILIREGSAAKNFEALHPLLRLYPESVMFCSDDKHPHDLLLGHINTLVKRSLAYGYDLMDVLCCACFHPIQHYKLDVGLLQQGDSADFIMIDNLQDFNILETYIRGQLVANRGQSLIAPVQNEIINHFEITAKKEDEFILYGSEGLLQVIHAIDGELVTQKFEAPAKVQNNQLVSDPSRDILKLVVINRYKPAPPAIAFIHGFGLKQGALASCIAHDSHNIIAVGCHDKDLCQAVNAVIENKGGISLASDGMIETLPLPVAGIMSPDDGYTVARTYSLLDQKAKQLGTPLQAPFMTLSFMALLVIPSLKLSDRGLFDSQAFGFTSLRGLILHQDLWLH